jgi:hypothetical protein
MNQSKLIWSDDDNNIVGQQINSIVILKVRGRLLLNPIFYVCGAFSLINC